MIIARARRAAWALATVTAATSLLAACGSEGAAPANGHAGGSAGNVAGASASGGTAATGGSIATGGTGTAGSAASTPGTGGRAPGAGGAAGAGARMSDSGGRAGSNGAASGASNAAGGADAAGAPAAGGVGGASSGRGGRGGANAGAPGASGGSAGGSAGSGGLTVPAGYTLVWHDEFDGEGPPDPKNWKFETGFVRNEEDQWYQTDNANVADGMLVIEARKERVTNPKYTGSGDWKTSRQYAEYTSSSINTSGLQSFQYGRFEMRARIPTSAGMWPAWWTLGVSGEWPSNGEIDIMEFYQQKVLANVACGTSTEWQAKWDSATKSLASLGATWAENFHVWRMDWDDQNIALYLDDQTMNTATLSSMLNADGKSPFKQKAYMLLNLALGGQNGGSPSGTAFPQRYEIDYVRVFQKN